MTKPISLEALAQAYDQNEALRADTEALQIRLEGLINTGLASCDPLDEATARNLQTKQAQLTMVPGKIGRINARAEELRTAIRAEFNDHRFPVFSSELQRLQALEKKRIMDALAFLMIDRLVLEELTNRMIWCQSKLAVELTGLEDAVKFPLTLDKANIVTAAKELIKRERELAQIKARPQTV